MEFCLAENIDTPEHPLLDDGDESKVGEIGLTSKKKKLDELEVMGLYAAERKGRNGNPLAYTALICVVTKKF